jgi:glycosyltransferase involved in cell wall biosynthesis
VKVFIVIPAHNEEKRIGPVLAVIKKLRFTSIVVDDGSKDKTLETAKKYTPFALHHGINLGKGAALKTGCEAAFSLGADTVIIMDSDGQHKPQDLPKFINALKKYSVVLGRRDFSGIPLVRLIGNRVISLAIELLFGIKAFDILCGFKAFTKEAYRKIKWDSLGYSVETEIVAMTGKHHLTNCEVPVATVYYDKFKGLTIQEGIGILLDIFKFRLLK